MDKPDTTKNLNEDESKHIVDDKLSEREEAVGFTPLKMKL